MPKVARGFLGPAIGSQHTLVDCLVGPAPRIPSAGLLICDAIVYAGLSASRRAKNAVPYYLISPECLDQIRAAVES